MNMFDGFVRVGAATPEITVGDCKENTDRILRLIREAAGQNCKLLVFPELCITGYTCGDLFQQQLLLDCAWESLLRIVRETASLPLVSVVGLPVMYQGKLYNCGAVVFGGNILGIVPKANIPNYTEFYEGRYFTPYDITAGAADTPLLYIAEDGESVAVPFGALLFECFRYPGFTFGVEICEDLWVGNTPSVLLCREGASVICNLSASNEIIGKKEYRRTIISAKSGSNACAYIYADAGEGESTTDVVYAGHKIICENGSVLSESALFGDALIFSDIDIARLTHERRRMNTFIGKGDVCTVIDCGLPFEENSGEILRKIPMTPFVPADSAVRAERCRDILAMQTAGLKKRLKHTRCHSAVLGISGGLDSTLALLVTVQAFDALQRERSEILAVTMPCFGTSDRTYRNAVALCRTLGVTLREINIEQSVRAHFRDIGQAETLHDVTYENGQARERTQVLMDLANMTGGLVIGTGDLSESALGWATYNGDHMSMYAVNSSIPKTLVRYLVDYYAENSEENLRETLRDILDTPVSPELLPPEDGKISQKTEDLVGPYELHDFFLYYFLRFGCGPRKIFRMAVQAFQNVYSVQTIIKWLETFTRRFFAQQFKRSCMPDGPKVGSVTLSPRGDLRLPSDASSRLWMDEILAIKAEWEQSNEGK